MGFVYGVAALAVAVVMVLIARPRAGKSPLFLSSWVIGQVYVLVAMVATVIGVALIIGAMPALL